MLKIKKKYIDGYVVLPCFKVKCIENGVGCDFVGSNFLMFIFDIFFSPFWDGKVVVTGTHYE